MSAFYNEIDRYPAAWLRNLIDAGHIAPGVVDERSIVDLDPEELRGYTQAHFFAGIGVWSHALRLAGWPDDAPAWTGSCPCQPFSAAGKRLGHADERHLWPAWFRLVRECRPTVVFGEQVASAAGRDWLAAVRADLEGAGYAVGAADLCAAGAGAPHIRQRLYFVAVADAAVRGPLESFDGRERETRNRKAQPPRNGPHGLVADAQRERGRGVPAGIEDAADARAPGEAGDVGQPDDEGLEGRPRIGEGGGEPGRQRAEAAGRGPAPGATGFWSDAAWVWCRDGVWRPHGPESFPLAVAHGATGRVGRLRAYGNAIVAPLAAEFVRAFMDTTQGEER